MQATDFVNRQMAIEKITEIVRRKEAEMRTARPERAETLAAEVNGLRMALIAIRTI